MDIAEFGSVQLMRKSRLSQDKQERLIEYFVSGATASLFRHPRVGGGPVTFNAINRKRREKTRNRKQLFCGFNLFALLAFLAVKKNFPGFLPPQE